MLDIVGQYYPITLLHFTPTVPWKRLLCFANHRQPASSHSWPKDPPKRSPGFVGGALHDSATLANVPASSPRRLVTTPSCLLAGGRPYRSMHFVLRAEPIAHRTDSPQTAGPRDSLLSGSHRLCTNPGQPSIDAVHVRASPFRSYSLVNARHQLLEYKQLAVTPWDREI